MRQLVKNCAADGTERTLWFGPFTPGETWKFVMLILTTGQSGTVVFGLGRAAGGDVVEELSATINASTVGPQPVYPVAAVFTDAQRFAMVRCDFAGGGTDVPVGVLVEPVLGRQGTKELSVEANKPKSKVEHVPAAKLRAREGRHDRLKAPASRASSRGRKERGRG